MQRRVDSPADVERAAERLRRPHARIALAVKRLFDFALSVAMLVALVPLLAVVVVMLAGEDDGWLERRVRLGRDGRAVTLRRFRRLPGGRLGRALERAGARDLPLLVSVVRGQLSFVGPRPLPPGTGARHTGPRRLMAPGLIGPAQRWAADAESAARMDDNYVVRWTLLADLRLLLCVRCRPPASPVH